MASGGSETHQTRLAEILPNGDICLTSDDAAVQHKARQARSHPGENKTYVYWDGMQEKRVSGPVTDIVAEPGFIFTVKAVTDEPVNRDEQFGTPPAS